jgi:hypothetical protein
LTMCATYFEIGRMIVGHEQDGKARAEYGRGPLVLEFLRLLKRYVLIDLKRCTSIISTAM